MSSKPKYYYNLSIYGPEQPKKNEVTIAPKPHGWYFPLGLGKHIISLFDSSKANAKKLTNKGSDLLKYASSLEGTVKLGFIASCTCVGGIVTLALRPPGRIRKLFYPTLFLATSSAICYPSTAYMLTKTAAIYTYTGGEKAYGGVKVVGDKMSGWRSAKKAKEEEERKKLDEIEKTEFVPEFPTPDTAPIRNPPVSDLRTVNELVIKTESGKSIDENPIPAEKSSEHEEEAVVETKNKVFELPTLRSLIQPIEGEKDESDKNEPADSIQDPGQSSKEDSDLYTTRS